MFTFFVHNNHKGAEDAEEAGEDEDGQRNFKTKIVVFLCLEKHKNHLILFTLPRSITRNIF